MSRTKPTPSQINLAHTVLGYRPSPGLAPKKRWWALALLIGASFLCTCGGVLLRLATP
jgi:hypothetical protein